MKAVAIIPARGGSKGVPGKNIRPLGGRPLLAWSIDAALDAGIAPYVSSDSLEILEIAASHGAGIIRRPEVLATDTALTDPVLLHALGAVGVLCKEPIDYIVTLQPTCPIRRPGLVRECLEKIRATDADSLFTGYRLHFVWWKETVGPDSMSAEVWRSQCPRRPRRQDMVGRERQWSEDGSVFVTRTAYLEATGARIGGHIEHVETERTVDIDTEYDFRVAEALLWARDEVRATA